MHFIITTRGCNNKAKRTYNVPASVCLIIKYKKERFKTMEKKSYTKIIPLAFLVLLITALTFLTFPANNSVAKQILSKRSDLTFGQNTPSRVGKNGVVSAMFNSLVTLEAAYKDSDLVAEVIITGWLGDTAEWGQTDGMNPAEITFFQATIVETYKNDSALQGKSITILQSGNRNWTYEGYPLYKNGDRLLLCLKRAENNMYTQNKQNCYIISGAQMTELQIIEEQGTSYAVKNNTHAVMPATLMAINGEKANSIINSLYNNDSLLGEVSFTGSVYDMKDITALIKKLK